MTKTVFSHIFFLVCCIVSSHLSFAQNPTPIVATDILQTGSYVNNDVGFYFNTKAKVDPKQLHQLPYSYSAIPEMAAKGKAPIEVAGKYIYLKLILANGFKDSLKIAFTPGYFNESMEVFAAPYHANKWVSPTSLSQVNEAIKKNPKYAFLTLPGNDTIVYYFKVRLIKSAVNTIHPAIVNIVYIPYFEANIKLKDYDINILTYLITGIFIMMLIYSASTFRQTSKPEFFYYFSYTTLTAILIFFKAYFTRENSYSNFYFEGFFDFVLHAMSIVHYMFFVEYFLDTPRRYRLLYHWYRFGAAFTLSCLSGYIIAFKWLDDFLLANSIEMITKAGWLIFGLGFVLFGIIQRKDKLMSYLVWGNSFLIFFGFLSFVLLSKKNLIAEESILKYSFFYFLLGTLLETALFLMGLAYKNKEELIAKIQAEESLKNEQEKANLEKNLAIISAQHDERTRISADMHDELGSGMTAIRLNSEILKRKLQPAVPQEIERISNYANDLLNKMNAIIWSMSAANDSIENTVAYIRNYTQEFFENCDLQCNFLIPEELPKKDLPGVKRRNLFLAYKESLNNILKHAGATEVNVRLTVIPNGFQLSVQDNGKGIEEDKIRQFGNGLLNMKRRMENIGGQFNWIIENGTTLQFTILY